MMVISNHPIPLNSQNIKAIALACNAHVFFHIIDALEHFGLSTDECILVITSGSISLSNKVRGFSNRFSWYDVYTLSEVNLIPYINILPVFIARRLSNSFIADLMRIRKARLYLSRVFPPGSSVSYLISGFYGHPIDRMASAIVNHDNFILVDDGNMTREVVLNRATEVQNKLNNVLQTNSAIKYFGIKGYIKLFLIRKLMVVKDLGSQSIQFFTHHHDLITAECDRIIPHVLNMKKGNRDVEPKVVHFLGMPALKLNIVSETDFRYLLSSVATRYKDYEIVYYPHPAEGNEELIIVDELLKDTVVNIQALPYEKNFENMDKSPAVVASFYSSALTNLVSTGSISSRIEALNIPPQFIISDIRRSRVSKIYDRIEQDIRIHYIPAMISSQNNGEEMSHNSMYGVLGHSS